MQLIDCNPQVLKLNGIFSENPGFCLKQIMNHYKSL